MFIVIDHTAVGYSSLYDLLLLKIINVFMQRLYSFYTPEVGDIYNWPLQFVNPIVKALY